MNGKFMGNRSFVEYEDLLKEVHALIAAGKGDSPEADAVRDRMEPLEAHLSPDEIERLNGLSADLYMLQDDETFEPLEERERTRERLGAALKEAWDAQDWPRALALLRKGPLFLTEPQVAYLRFRAYTELGHIDTARLFLEHAAILDPDSVTYRSLLVDFLEREGRSAEALMQAEAALADPKTPFVLQLQAAGILIRATSGTSGQDTAGTYERAIRALSAALEGDPGRSAAPAFRAAGYAWLGTCYQSLGKIEEARASYDAALAIDPDYDAALVARGALRVKEDPKGAHDDFERAVRGGTVLAAPYAYLAEQSLAHGDYDRCLDLCERTLRLADKPQMIAAALHWRAIAQYELGAPAEVARAGFTAALEMDPFNDTVRANLEEFELVTQARDAGGQHHFTWQTIDSGERLEAIRELRDHPMLPAGAPA